jgi:phosphoribosylformylglycinamidine cyclo-ligase
MLTNNKHLKYKDAGVDINKGNALVEDIKNIAKKTTRPEVLGGIGGFGALCKIPANYNNPILVSSTDGVGTKLKLAGACNNHHTIGIDLVAMCVNDLLSSGAEPLFFLDYFATGKLDISLAKQVIEGIAEGCKLAGCALIGGETAEMPGLYTNTDYDLAGFCVGVAEEDNLLKKSSVKAGDVLIGIESSGLHSNGYSLVRKIIQDYNLSLDYKLSGKKLSDWLLEPTKIYVKSVLGLLSKNKINAIAHITGGGLTENLPRVFNDNLQASIQTASWDIPEIFTFLQQQANIEMHEMYRVFNCGIGMVLVVSKENQQEVLSHLQQNHEQAKVIGSIENKTNDDAVVFC